MDADARRLKIDGITEKIIGAAFVVSNTLGTGFLEKVYENALAHELSKQGLDCDQQRPVEVWYDGIVAGHYVTDLVVENFVLVELKVAESLEPAHLAQCLNYLKATRLSTCLLLNFGNSKVEFKRIVNNF